MTNYKGTTRPEVCYSSTLKMDWNYSVYLPENYDKDESRTYPLLYLLHGAKGNHRNFLERFSIETQLNTLIEKGVLDPLIVVFVDGFNSFYVNGYGMHMERALVEDLFPYIETNYRIQPGREHHYIGGISMGGYGASNLALTYPEMFARVMIASPAVWETMTQEVVTYDWHVFREADQDFDDAMWHELHPLTRAKALNEDVVKPSFIILHGVDDTVVPLDVVTHFVNELKQGFDVTWIPSRGDHSWEYWERAIFEGLRYLMNKKGG